MSALRMTAIFRPNKIAFCCGLELRSSGLDVDGNEEVSLRRINELSGGAIQADDKLCHS